MKCYMGIDPGASGGCAVVYEEGKIARVFKFKGLTLVDLNRQMCECKRDFAPIAVLEKVHSMPGQGVSSTFKFGQNYGQLEMCLVGLKIPYTLVTPAKWQGVMSCRTKGDKNVTKAKAQQTWPGVKVIHAIADAMLLAEYCRITERSK